MKEQAHALSTISLRTYNTVNHKQNASFIYLACDIFPTINKKKCRDK